MRVINYVLIYKKQILNIVKSIIENNKKQFYELQNSCSIRFEDVLREMKEYGEVHFIQIPDEGFGLAYVYDVSNNKKRIELPLWTEEEGVSDLYIYFICSYGDNKKEIEVYDIHVP